MYPMVELQKDLCCYLITQPEAMCNSGIMGSGVIQICDLPMEECAFGVMGCDFDHHDRYG